MKTRRRSLLYLLLLVPGQLVCVCVCSRRGHVPVCGRKFNFTVFPLWMTTERFPGRLCPFISSDQIFTVRRMACLASRSPFFFFPGQVFEPFRAVCVPFGWTRATSHSAGPVLVSLGSFHKRNRLRSVLTYAVLAGSTRTTVFHVLTVLVSAFLT